MFAYLRFVLLLCCVFILFSAFWCFLVPCILFVLFVRVKSYHEEKKVKTDLMTSFILLLKWHLLVTGNYGVSAKISEFEIESRKKEKLLGISTDTALSFEHHITSLCKKASQKLHALARIAHYMDFEKRRSLMKAFVISQFNYCPLIWMFHNSTK